MSWNDFLCLQDIGLSTEQPVHGTNAKLTWKEKTATTIPLDPATYLPLASLLRLMLYYPSPPQEQIREPIDYPSYPHRR